MNWQPPTVSVTWKAIDLYLSLAYAGEPPLAVRARLDAMRASNEDEFYRIAAFERTPAESPAKYSLRLGNRFYPHMKLVIECAPDGTQVLFRADTHDRHVQPKPNSPEAAAFAELSKNNQDLAQQIESAWDEQGLPTFKRYLREDLARRRAALSVEKSD
ncbi:MAG TPA: hypothetical protein VFC46_02280 [Humisphaera sp.]|nr:hypothetical protein [Humisphaera sp.]